MPEESKPQIYYQLWMLCVNCGRRNLTHHLKGAPIVWSKMKKECEKCGCDAGWERVDE